MKWSPAVAFFTHYHHSWIRTPPPDPPPQSSSTISLSSGYQQKSVLLTPIADTYYLAHTHTTALAFRAPTATPHLYSRVHRSHSIAVNTLETLWYLSKAKEPHFSFGHHLMLLSDMTIKYISRRHSGVVLCCVVFLVSYHLVLDQTGRLCRLWCLSCFVFFTPPILLTDPGSWTCSKWKLQIQQQTSITTPSYKGIDFPFGTCPRLPKMEVRFTPCPNINLDNDGMQKFWLPD